MKTKVEDLEYQIKDEKRKSERLENLLERKQKDADDSFGSLEKGRRELREIQSQYDELKQTYESQKERMTEEIEQLTLDLQD